MSDNSSHGFYSTIAGEELLCEKRSNSENLDEWVIL